MAWVRRLARGEPAVRAALDAALRDMWDETLCWFGPPGAPGALAEARALDAAPDTLRARFLAAVGPAIVASGVGLPLRPAADGDTWELTSKLPWSTWNAQTYRLEASAHATTRGSDA